MIMNAVVKVLNCRFYLKELLLLLGTYLLMEGMFAWLIVHNSGIIENYQKGVSIFIYAYMLYSFRKLARTEQLLIGGFSVLMVRLVFVSLSEYNNFFQQFTMFTVMFPVVFMLFVKHILRSLDIDLLEFLAKFYLLSYVLMMLLYGRAFSFGLESIELDDYGPFSGDTRIIHASHIFMIIIPLLWYLHRSIETGKAVFIAGFIFCVGIIVIHQHRSVWSSALFALFFYLLACSRNRIISSKKIIPAVAGGAILLLIAVFFTANLFPGFWGSMQDRFMEIFNPSKEGSTGNFRILQRETYFALFMDKPVFGWAFEGFNMPNPLVDWWPDGTGQHFHEGYIETLFYHGIVGLLLKYSVLFYLLVKLFSRKLSGKAIILASFCVSGLLFSFNYVLPLVFWGHVGACLFYLDKDKL